MALAQDLPRLYSWPFAARSLHSGAGLSPAAEQLGPAAASVTLSIPLSFSSPEGHESEEAVSRRRRVKKNARARSLRDLGDELSSPSLASRVANIFLNITGCARSDGGETGGVRAPAGRRAEGGGRFRDWKPNHSRNGSRNDRNVYFTCSSCLKKQIVC